MIPQKPDSVRVANYRDEGPLYDLLIAMHRYQGNGWGMPYRPELVLERIERGTRPDYRTRSNPQDRDIGIIGVVGPEGGKLEATIGLFVERPMWFSETVAMIELWVFVRPEARGVRHLERDLFAFATWAHESMKAHPEMKDQENFWLQTGFLHFGPRFPKLARVWGRLSGASPVGMLFVKR